MPTDAKDDIVAYVRRAGRCRTGVRRRRGEKRCTKRVPAGTLTRTLATGALRFRLTGRIGTKALLPGRYELAAVATDAAGNASRAKRARFRIVR